MTSSLYRSSKYLSTIITKARSGQKWSTIVLFEWEFPELTQESPKESPGLFG